jgi:hypothetical protein
MRDVTIPAELPHCPTNVKISYDVYKIARRDII